MTHDAEYERLLAALVGDSFEEEICDRLRAVVSDFQRIPRKGGDAGLDGLSHRQSRAYCCYGPQLDHAKLADKVGLKNDIVTKFRDDLRKLCEVAHEGKTKLVKCEGDIGTVLAEGCQLASVVLIVNWFEDKKIVGLLNTSFRKFLKASACRYISPECGLSIWGPTDVAGLALVDDATRFRAENRVLVTKLKEASVAAPPQVPASTLKDFDSKFDWIIAQDAANANIANELREKYRAAWSRSLVLETQLEGSAVRLHEALESAREQAATNALARSIDKLPPGRLLADAVEDIRRHLSIAFGDGGLISTAFVQGEVARLVGECPIEWRK